MTLSSAQLRSLQQPRQSQDNEANLDEILRGLCHAPKRLPCKLFYDARGSRLFERITRLPEYYPTRAELDILRSHGSEIAGLIGPRAVLVELGSGASVKTRVLLDALERPRVYVPIDISPSALMDSATELRSRYPELDVRPLAADYTRKLTLPLDAAERTAQLSVFFPGSTIGNFERHEAEQFLRRVRQDCGEQQRFLIGVDVPKDRATLEAAYNDSAGVTAEFNYNILRVLNRDYGGRFNIEDFAHRAIWNEPAGRIEMHLVSRRAQTAWVGKHAVVLGAEEAIVTEHCYKYARGDFAQLAESAGFKVLKVWTDSQALFSLHLLAVA
jgi:dimethylhistidine N-methyltransferase